MKINFLDEKVIKGEKSILLAGPTHEGEIINSWRNNACIELKKLGFDGVVYVPEYSMSSLNLKNTDKGKWELEALEESTVILFWVPNNLEDTPAFETNSLFGYCMSTGKVVYGRQGNSSKAKYIDWLYNFDYSEKPCSNLNELLESSINKANKSFEDKVKVLKNKLWGYRKYENK